MMVSLRNFISRLFPLLALLLSLSACNRDDRKSLHQAWQAVSGASDSALQELKKLSPEDAAAEYRKLRQFQYKVLTMPASEAPQKIEETLNAQGQEFWECFHIERRMERDIENYLVFCRRRPDTLLKFVPQTFLGR